MAWRFLLLGIVTVLNTAQAGPFNLFEKAFMPGNLTAAHAKYENQCEKCHKSFDKAAQSGLCRDCHEKIDGDLKKHHGLHGRTARIRHKPCQDCHTEHKGRQAKIVWVDEDNFDHDQTDFLLAGRHDRISCRRCHKYSKKHQRIRYVETPSRCYDCHKKDDTHNGRLGKDCRICHRESRWRDFVFSHDNTDFPLKGTHRDVQCVDCHINERYKNTPTRCYNCHRRDDKHKGRYGKKCKSCHSPRGWPAVVFDHNNDTKFKLKHKHTTLTCRQCHKGERIYEENLDGKCHSCHKLDDVHKGLNGKQCNQCHTARGFNRIRFDHEKTDFPLKGKHKKVDCKDCHQGDVKKDLPGDCFSCHRQDDAHRGQQGKQCHRCHTEAGWGKQVNFDHELSKFPLVGAHATLPCERCHLTASFKEADVNCVSCHQDDDVHEQTLGTVCQFCHNATDWKAWVFDHNEQTRFKLDGAHEKLICRACHRTAVKGKIRMIRTCDQCHGVDDIHEGRYGRFCQRCHTTEAFDDTEKFNP